MTKYITTGYGSTPYKVTNKGDIELLDAPYGEIDAMGMKDAYIYVIGLARKQERIN
jgi:hypothetical protein